MFTCEEWKQFASMLFSRVDKNADKFLSASEFHELRNSEQLFASADVSYFDDDQDKRVSKKEFVDKPNPFFARYDLSSDCRVTAQELKDSSTNARKDKGPPGKGGSMAIHSIGAF